MKLTPLPVPSYTVIRLQQQETSPGGMLAQVSN
jgi:hypothetical protein